MTNLFDPKKNKYKPIKVFYFKNNTDWDLLKCKYISKIRQIKKVDGLHET